MTKYDRYTVYLDKTPLRIFERKKDAVAFSVGRYSSIGDRTYISDTKGNIVFSIKDNPQRGVGDVWSNEVADPQK